MTILPFYPPTHSEPTFGVKRRESLQAVKVLQSVAGTLESRNLPAPITDPLLSRVRNMTLLVIPLDTSRLADHSRYTHPDFLHQLSTNLGGLRVYLSNTTGLRYVVLLSPFPRLPRNLELPETIPGGIVLLGMGLEGQQVQRPWSKLGHLLVAGMSGSGKSWFLQSLVYQASRSGLQLALADLDQASFRAFEAHPNLYHAIAATPRAVVELLQKLIGECDTRAALYQSMPGLPESIEEYNTQAVRAGKEPLKRILFVMDEASSILTATGGGSGEIASRLAQLAWRGRKFGLSTVFGAQEFTKTLLGPARDQTNLTLAFRVRPSAAQMARIVGCEGAERIPAGIPGRAILDQVGPLQVYYVPKSRLLAEHTSLLADSLTDLERQLFARSLNETEGRLPLGRIHEWAGIPMHQARKLQECWALRGWIVKSAGQDNSFCLTAKARDLLANLQTPQTPADRREPPQTQS